jgi:hypothetical protein
VIRPACGATNLTARSIQGSTTLGKRLVRKNFSVQNGEQVLFDEIRYFFYITNRTPEQIVSLANGPLQSGECDRAAQKRSQCHAHAGGRLAEQTDCPLYMAGFACLILLANGDGQFRGTGDPA